MSAARYYINQLKPLYLMVCEYGRLNMFRFKVIPLIFVFGIIMTSGCMSNEEKKISYLESGNTYFDKEEYKSAELEFRNAIQIDPNFIDAYQRLGETYLKLGKPRESFKAFDTVIKLDPDNTDAQLKLATFYLLGKKIKKSREKVDAVLKKEPDNIEALFLLAGIQELNKTLNEASSTLRK
ncbi:MAG TPA: tetratricopeptide repeat protein, partial [Desulfobacteraceae bacterium]|nr:tetratricopeptide repeat protein [Desulfobacteraceae bacterium]